MVTATDRRQGVNSSAAVKVPVRVATTANITLSGLQTIDGVTLVANDRVLVKNQSTASQNGIYDASSGTWNRSPDCDGYFDLKTGTLVSVNAGTTSAGFAYKVTSADPVVVGTSNITWAVAGFASGVSIDDSLVLVTSPLTGGAARTQHSKNTDFVTLSDFDGTYTQKWTAALASGAAQIYIDVGGTLTSSIAIPAATHVWAKHIVVAKAFNGDLITDMGQQSSIEGIFFDLQGATYTGRGCVITGGFSQHMTNVGFGSANGYALEFTTADAGQHFIALRCSFSRTTFTPCVKLPADASSGNRLFHGCEALAQVFVDFDGSFNTQIIGSAFSNLSFANSAATSLRAIIQGNRIAALSGTLAIQGNDVCVQGNVIAGDVTLGVNSSRNIIGPNSLLAGTTITDNNTNGGDDINLVYDSKASVTPVWGADSSAPAIGNGSLTGRVVRDGRLLTVNIGFAAGSTTTFGTGAWYFTLPSPFSQFKAKYDAIGSVWILDNGTAFFVGVCRIVTNANKIYMFTDNGATGVTGSVPMTWANTDTLSLTITFEVGGT